MQRDLPAGQSYERLWREESPDALVVLSVQGEVMLWNRMAEVIFGYTPAQAEGRLLTDLIVPADRIDEELAARRDADDGIGISAEDQARLFAAFTQVGDPRRRPDGTGMGLHVCATLATLMGGRIEVESQPGAGSRFSLVMERC